ncbi:response regulator transcription factor [Chitinophaga sp. Cy-1792]|uniref:response regulator transcription factor n=1 Tax=Chitinophaga sp. Cy-1792 TaxID=2608339 RepID=UPI001420CD83|nr:response regulator [Chitinophaga sp. Cy-1792]NIG52191.1 response regulator [Chitinophaga sp. Cy-1792]
MLHRDKTTAWNRSESVPTDNRTAGPNILIIDDEPDICRLLQLNLVRHGYAVRYVHALHDGLQFLKSHKPDLLFLDIHLPDGSGLEALPVIKALDPSLPIITISAYDNESEKQQALTTGASFFLAKPFNVRSVDELLNRIKS